MTTTLPSLGSVLLDLLATETPEELQEILSIPTPTTSAGKQYYWSNHDERIKASRDSYYSKHEHHKQILRDYYARNKPYFAAYYAEYRKTHREQLNAATRAWRARKKAKQTSHP